MKLLRPQRPRGIALIIVMIVITALAIMAAGFAYSMKVETRLARNASFDPEMDWVGRSGVELAKYIIGQQKNVPNEPYDSLNQLWAGGIGNTNGLLSDVSLKGNAIGRAAFDLSIVDSERKFNINAANELVLARALDLIGVEASENTAIINSILDWIDTDDDTRINGTESDYYEGLTPGYVAKNGPLDNIAELLLIRTVPPEIYWGPKWTGSIPERYRKKARVGFQEQVEDGQFHVGLADLFTPFGSRQININTASIDVLQLVPGVDTNSAAGIIQRRAGPDGADGTDDDTPLRGVGELAGVPGIDPRSVQQLAPYCITLSTTFEVEVDITLDSRKRKYYAVLRRLDPRNIQIIHFHWK